MELKRLSHSPSRQRRWIPKRTTQATQAAAGIVAVAVPMHQARVRWEAAVATALQQTITKRKDDDDDDDEE